VTPIEVLGKCVFAAERAGTFIPGVPATILGCPNPAVVEAAPGQIVCADHARSLLADMVQTLVDQLRTTSNIRRGYSRALATIGLDLALEQDRLANDDLALASDLSRQYGLPDVVTRIGRLESSCVSEGELGPPAGETG